MKKEQIKKHLEKLLDAEAELKTVTANRDLALNELANYLALGPYYYYDASSAILISKQKLGELFLTGEDSE